MKGVLRSGELRACASVKHYACEPLVDQELCVPENLQASYGCVALFAQTGVPNMFRVGDARSCKLPEWSKKQHICQASSNNVRSHKSLVGEKMQIHPT